jgi:pimeloyl-ACP methyl ester carboxylesterase
MKVGADHAQPDDEPAAEWDETVLVWNATVARIPATAVRPDSADDATSAAAGKATPDRGATGGGGRPFRQAAGLGGSRAGVDIEEATMNRQLDVEARRRRAAEEALPSRQGRARTKQTHSDDVRRWYERALAGASVRGRTVEERGGGRVHLLEKGAGPPVVLVHGSGVAAGFFLPLLKELEGVRALAPDLPGSGLSDPIDRPQHRHKETTVAWLDRLLDALDLDTTVLLGHSAGGVWALRYALAHPERVKRLVLIGPPALPKTRCPLPYRLMATPGVGALLSRVPPSPKSVLRFAEFMGERATLAAHPDLVDLFVVAGQDPLAVSALRAEVRELVSPFALLTPSGFRHRSRVRPDELRRLAMPTLLIWGEREPLGSVSVAQAVTELIPRGRLQVLPTGHGPWLGQPAQTAAIVVDFVRGST